MSQQNLKFQQQHERRFCGLDLVRSVDGSAVRISGLAAVFYDGTPATQYTLWKGALERIMPGAFDRAVAEDDVVGLFNHDPNQILGRKVAGSLALGVEPRGLRYTITPGDNDLARRVADYVARREVTGSSFSFKITDETWKREDSVDIREVRGVKLYDVGPVTFPAYSATTAEAAGYNRDLQAASQSYLDWINKVNARRMSVAKTRS